VVRRKEFVEREQVIGGGERKKVVINWQKSVTVGPWRSWERVPVKPGKSQAKIL